MTPTELENLVSRYNRNSRRAVEHVESDSEKRQLLKHYYDMLLPIRSNCSNVSPADSMRISLMCQLYKSLNPRAYIRATACALPDSLAKVGRYLKGVGVTT